jgi:AhpD family alkylhydroperoxidase
MKSRAFASVVLLILTSTISMPAASVGPAIRSSNVSLITLDELDKIGRSKVNVSPRVSLADATGEKLKAVRFADPLGSEQVPNYVKALAQQTEAAQRFADMVRVFLYSGTLPPELKMAMAARIAQQLGSAYTAAHAMRWLRSSEHGRELLALMRSDKLDGLTPAEQLGLAYADSLTHGVHDVSDAEFQKTRAFYNDSQIVELTMSVCFFNYFTRLNETLNLPVEAWVLDGPDKTPKVTATYQPPVARVSLVSDEQISAATSVAAAAMQPQKPAGGLGLGMANSQRAFLLVPALGQAWRDYGAAARENFTINRAIQLQVSFAVSTANGCRYCTLHQVLGLRRLGVDVGKLVSMKRDDSSLTPRELTAVSFARKVTREPAAVTDEDFNKLKREFGERGAFEVLLQTCGFSFMNRFTDGLRLPSEDEAIRVYKETYGSNWQ